MAHAILGSELQEKDQSAPAPPEPELLAHGLKTLRGRNSEELTTDYRERSKLLVEHRVAYRQSPSEDLELAIARDQLLLARIADRIRVADAVEPARPQDLEAAYRERSELRAEHRRIFGSSPTEDLRIALEVDERLLEDIRRRLAQKPQ